MEELWQLLNWSLVNFSTDTILLRKRSSPTPYYKYKYLLNFPPLPVLHFVVRNVGYKGRPRISGRKRGPLPNWSPQRHCGKNTIHLNRPNIERNRKLKKIDPQAKDEYVLTAQRGSEILSKGHEVEIHGPCRIVYRSDLPHSCGATVWIETLATVTMFNFDGMVERVDSRWVWEEEDMWKINKKSIEELIRVWN